MSTTSDSPLVKHGVDAAVPARDWRDWLKLLAFLAVLSVPAIVGALGWQPGGKVQENRALSDAPAYPRNMHEAMLLPGRLSALANDHFGLRSILLEHLGKLRYRLFGEFLPDQVMQGQGKRLFLTSHMPGRPFSLIDESCGVGLQKQDLHAASQGLAQLLEGARKVAPQVVYLGIPTAPVLHAEDLPRWVAERCASGRPVALTMQAELAQERPDLVSAVTIPLEPLLRMKQEGEPPIPLRNFHWEGQAGQRIAQVLGETILGMPARHPIPAHIVRRASDLAQFTPGLNWQHAGADPDHAAAGIRICYGAQCLPEAQPYARIINELTLTQWNEGGGPRLLLISDSFGARVAHFLGAYVGQMLHVNIAFPRMNQEERAGLRQALFEQFRPDIIVFLQHDGGMRSAAGWAFSLFGP